MTAAVAYMVEPILQSTMCSDQYSMLEDSMEKALVWYMIQFNTAKFEIQKRGSKSTAIL